MATDNHRRRRKSPALIIFCAGTAQLKPRTAPNISCYSYPMSSTPNKTRKLAPIWRALVEVGFIVFLFYSNLLMGEFTHSNGQGKSLAFGVQDISTMTNFVIAIISGLIGYVIVEYLR
jgi:hypothetical protein